MKDLEQETERLGGLLYDFARRYHCFSVAADDDESTGVLRDMQDGEVDDEGWVRWKVLPSKLGADACGDRSRIEEHAQALDDNFHELVHDVFGDVVTA